MAIQPPEIDAFPPPPQRGNKETFADLFDAVITWFSISVSKVGQACLSAYQNAVAAALSASSAEAAAEAATFASGAVQWVSGTTYVKGKVVWSPANGRTYRRLIAGGGATDPAADRVNWVTLSSEPDVLATATVTTAVANIDFLNIFTADYDKYTIELQGMITSNNTVGINFQLAAAGSVIATNTYWQGLSGSNLNIDTTFQLTPASNNAGTFTVEIRNANSTTTNCSFGSRGVINSAANNPAAAVKEGYSSSAGVKSGFRIQTSESVFTAGTVRVFGHRNS